VILPVDPVPVPLVVAFVDDGVVVVWDPGEV